MPLISNNSTDNTGNSSNNPDNSGNNTSDNTGGNTDPVIIYSIVKLWELTETCNGSNCEKNPYQIKFNLDSKPDDETFLTYDTYLQLTDDFHVKIYMKILSKTDPYKVLTSYNVGTILHCSADDETYSADISNFNISNIGGGTFTVTENSLSFVYNNGDKDSLMSMDSTSINGYIEKCLK